MEADWEFELGPDEAGTAAPVIDAHWAGFVDLQRSPEFAAKLPETVEFPAIANTLVKLNAVDSLVWSSKCDYWPNLVQDEFDPDEMDAPPGSAAYGMGCYIDLLPKSDQQWAQPVMVEKSCKHVCGLLRVVPIRCCRADLVIRRAFITSEHTALGITVYVTSCGESPDAAKWTLQSALAALTDAFRATRR
jgi:hypothetical protein